MTVTGWNGGLSSSMAVTGMTLKEVKAQTSIDSLNSLANFVAFEKTVFENSGPIIIFQKKAHRFMTSCHQPSCLAQTGRVKLFAFQPSQLLRDNYWHQMHMRQHGGEGESLEVLLQLVI